MESTETKVALLMQNQERMEDQQKIIADAVTALQEERNRALRWGVMSLGTAVIGMALWIFNAVTGGHIK